MFNLLGVSLAQFLSQTLIIVGLILIVIGISTLVLARRLTSVARQSEDVNSADKLFITFKVVGLIFLLAGFVCISVNVVLYILK